MRGQGFHHSFTVAANYLISDCKDLSDWPLATLIPRSLGTQKVTSAFLSHENFNE